MHNKFQILYLDPPWHYSQRCCHDERSTTGKKTKFGGGAQGQYPLMTDQALLDLAPGIANIAAPSSVMLMWATMPRLDFALELMKAWGFEYKTVAFNWIKISRNMLYQLGKGRVTPEEFLERFAVGGPGFYTASNSEIVLLGTRKPQKGVSGSGQTITPVKRMINSVVFYPRTEHSRKPDIVRDRISAMYGPDRSKVEIFTRFPRWGWTAIGNEVDGRDVKDVLETWGQPTPDPSYVKEILVARERSHYANPVDSQLLVERWSQVPMVEEAQHGLEYAV